MSGHRICHMIMSALTQTIEAKQTRLFMQRIEVAVGIILNTQGQVLVGQRLVEDAYFQKWEFPGGKLEQGESAQAALKRELQEELGIIVLQCQHFVTIEHDYADRNVRLSVRLINSFSGKPTGQEGQALQWLAPTELGKLDFLQGNQAIIEKLLLLTT